jgi:hypothetical protein
MAVAGRMTRRLAAAMVFGCTTVLTAAFATVPGAGSATASPAAGHSYRTGLLTQQAPWATAAASGPAGPAGLRPAAGASEELLDVSATSVRNAWAVGQLENSGATPVLHWNGTAWSHVAIPDPAVNVAADITAVSADNAWLVGSHCTSGCTTATPAKTTLVMHWNGTAWSRVASPGAAGMNSRLAAVSASSAGNAWAAGNACSTTIQSCVPLMLHWNGTTWSKVASPAIGDDDTLAAVQTTSATDAWAVGDACTTACHVPLVMHWNGRSWSAATLPATNITGLFGVTGTTTSDVWAVGNTYSNSTGYENLIYHWNGTSWSTVTHPDARGGLFAVTAISRTDAWAAGFSCTSKTCAASRTLTLHWNGSAWSKVASPNPGPGHNDTLAAVAATSASNAWAVGYNTRKGTSQYVFAPITLHWNGKAWVNAPLTSAVQHAHW